MQQASLLYYSAKPQSGGIWGVPWCAQRHCTSEPFDSRRFVETCWALERTHSSLRGQAAVVVPMFRALIMLMIASVHRHGRVALRRFAAVSPFCFGYPAQPDIASWRIRIIHNHFDRPTLFFATRRQGRYPRSLEAFFFTPVDFLSASRHDARAPLEWTKDVDFRRVQSSTEWCQKARNGSGGNVDDVDRSTSRRVGAWSIFWTSPELFSAVVSTVWFFLFCAGGPGEWAVVRLLRRRWTPAQDSCWSRQCRLLVVNLVSVFTISQSAFLWQCCTSIFIFVVLHLCTRRMISRQSPLKQTDSSWSNQRGYFTEGGRKNWTLTKSELLLHRHEATAPALAKEKLYAISMHCSWRT